MRPAAYAARTSSRGIPLLHFQRPVYGAELPQDAAFASASKGTHYETDFSGSLSTFVRFINRYIRYARGTAF